MRITEKMLDLLVERINKQAGTPLTYMREVEGKRFININHYHIDSCYGGVKLVQTDNDGGGIHCISNNGYTTKKDLFNQMQMFLAGLQAGSK